MHGSITPAPSLVIFFFTDFGPGIVVFCSQAQVPGSTAVRSGMETRDLHILSPRRASEPTLPPRTQAQGRALTFTQHLRVHPPEWTLSSDKCTVSALCLGTSSSLLSCPSFLKHGTTRLCSPGISLLSTHLPCVPVGVTLTTGDQSVFPPTLSCCLHQ